MLSSVDAEFVKRSGSNRPTFLRHVDDYWIAGNSHDECERHLQNLRVALRDHELDTNEAKTKIISVKYVFGDDWPFDFDDELRKKLTPIPFGLAPDPLPLLSRIVDQATQTNDDGLIRHAIRKVDELRRWNTDWEVLEHFLAQCAVQFPHSFDYVARVVAWRLRSGIVVDRELWIEVASFLAQANGVGGRDSETVWALWLLKELGHRLPKSITDGIIENNGALVLAFLAHFGKHKLASDRRMKEKLYDVINGDPLAGPYWPLTLELVHLGQGRQEWMTGSTTPSLKLLHEQRFSIIEWQARPRVFEEERDGPDHPPDNALEGYGDDYGEFDDEDGNGDGDDEPEVHENDHLEIEF